MSLILDLINTDYQNATSLNNPPSSTEAPSSDHLLAFVIDQQSAVPGLTCPGSAFSGAAAVSQKWLMRDDPAQLPASCSEKSPDPWRSSYLWLLLY